MLTEKECLAKALDARLRAEAHQDARESFLGLALHWEALAEQAAWQDKFEATGELLELLPKHRNP